MFDCVRQVYPTDKEIVMVFSSTVFLFLFLPIVLLVYYNPLVKARRTRNIILLIANLVFYAWGEPIFVFLMIFSIVLTWKCGLYIKENFGKYILIGITLYHIAVLFVFKYLTFTIHEFGLLIHKDLSFIQISLPIGISFFTFQLMSYLFDIYYQKVEPQSNLFNVALYATLFPSLTAGPIIRYREIGEQIIKRHENWDDITLGMKRFIIGLGKKVLISNYMAQIADNTFDYLSGMSVSLAWYGAIAYTLQIYFDFSGYSDMAIGLGRMFGFQFPENFNYPYIAKSITDFWRRWHISLSTWFRDYVYIPLGGNKVKKPRWILNLLIVWTLTGVWHGANWTYIAWGMLYFVFLVIEKLTGIEKKLGIFSHIYTLIIVILLWVIFRSSSISSAIIYIGNMFGVGANGFVDSAAIEYWKNTKLLFLTALVGCTPWVKMISERLSKINAEWITSLMTVVVFFFSILNVISSTYNPFIYFNF